MKYLLVREDEEDEEDEEQLWARCAAVEGLFVDPVPPPREILTLRGCAPAGSLRNTVIRPEAAAGLLGDMLVEVSDDTQPVGWWELVDAVILAQHPCRTDPSLVDVVMGACCQEAGGRCPHTARVAAVRAVHRHERHRSTTASRWTACSQHGRNRPRSPWSSSAANPRNRCSPCYAGQAGGNGPGPSCGRWTAPAGPWRAMLSAWTSTGRGRPCSGAR